MKLVHLVIGLAVIVASAIQTSAARPRIPHRHLQEEADAADDVTFDEYSTVEEEGWEEPEEPECGLLDEECCLDGGSPCLIGGTGCDIMGDMRCTVFCGGEGQPCCLGDICYSPSRGKAGKSGKNKSNEKRMRRDLSSGNSDSSTSSSGKNKSKSKSKSMSKGGVGRCKCICEPGLRFDYSTKTCEKCGKPDLPCCETEDGPVCNAGSTCLAATQVCKSCGNHAQPECSGDDEPCLAGNTPAHDGTCTKCGLEVDDPCCPVPDDSSKDGCEEDLQCGARGLCTEGCPRTISRSALESTEDFNPNLLKDDAVLQTQKAAECAFVANGNTYDICDLDPCSDDSYLVQDTVNNTMRIDKPKLRTCSKGDVNDAMIVVNRNKQGVILSIEVMMGGNEDLLLVAIDSVNKPNCLATILSSDYSTETLSKFFLANPKRDASNAPQGRKVKEETRPEDLRSKMLGRTPHNRRLQVVCTEFKEIELAVIYDHLFCQDAGGTALDAEKKVEYLVTLTSAKYQQVCTDIRLVYVSGYCDKAMDPFDRTNNTDLDNFGRYDAGRLLNEFRAYWQSKDGGVERVNRDLAHLLTGQPLGPTKVVDGRDEGHPVGRAWLGVLCNFDFHYGVDNAVELGSSHLAATIIAHEIGHNVGAEHLDTNRAVYDYNACYQAEPRKTLVATCSDLNDSSFNYDGCQGFGTDFFDICKEICETSLNENCTQSVDEDYQCNFVLNDDATATFSTQILPSCHIMYPSVAAGLSTFIQSSVDVLRMEIDECGSITNSTVACPTGYFKLFTLYSLRRDFGGSLFCVEVEAYNSGRCEFFCKGATTCFCAGNQTEVEKCCQTTFCDNCPGGRPPGLGSCVANVDCPTEVVSV